MKYLATCHCLHTGGKSRWNLDGHSVQPRCVQMEAGLLVLVPSLHAEPPSVLLGPLCPRLHTSFLLPCP